MFNRFITSPEAIVTTYGQTRAGFLSIALEKNRIGDPYVRNAFAFKTMVSDITRPEDLLSISQVRPFLLAASGLSDKSMQYLSTDDQTHAIEELIEKFLVPSGSNFVDEAIYRYLLIKGDAVGGIMRNRIGVLGQEKLIRCILACMNVQGIEYAWIQNEKGSSWKHKTENDEGIERTMKALYWKNAKGHRVLGFNLKIPAVSKNVDICLFACDMHGYNHGKIAQNPNAALMLGELKGGIDPAGADEHWKTANTALERIRTSFNSVRVNIATSFVGGAIANAMAHEIYNQLQSGTMTNAANLNDTDQLVEYCNWLIGL